MNETHVTIQGNVATAIEYKTSATGVPVVRFRLGSTVRRLDQQRGGWTDAFTSFYTVWAWRTLAINVASSVSKGEPLIVTGQLRIKETAKEGNRFVSADLTAASIGHDLTRGTSAFIKVTHAKPGLVSRADTASSPFSRPAPPPAESMTGPAAGPDTETAPGSGSDQESGSQSGPVTWTDLPDIWTQVPAP